MINPYIWIFLSFIALFCLCGKKVWIKVIEELDKHILKIKQDIDESLILKQQAEKHLNNIFNLKIDAENQTKKILEMTHQDILNLKESAKQDLQKFYELEQNQFVLHQKIIENQVYSRVEEILSKTSIDIVKQFVNDYPQPKMEDFLITQALEKIKSYDFKTLKNF